MSGGFTFLGFHKRNTRGVGWLSAPPSEQLTLLPTWCCLQFALRVGDRAAPLHSTARAVAQAWRPFTSKCRFALGGGD